MALHRISQAPANDDPSMRGIRDRNPASGKLRRVRSDAQIGNVPTLQARTPDVIDRLGARTTVGELRAVFGGRDVSEIAKLPKAQRAVAVERHLARQGVTNRAAIASITAALEGELGARVQSGKSYYVQIGGKRYDRDIIQAFLKATAGPRDREVSAAEARRLIAPALGDAAKVTSIEAETYLFCLRHFSTTSKAVREQLVPMLRNVTGHPVRQLENGKQGFEFGELYDYVLKNARISDLYAAKADMNDEEMMAMWDGGISLEDLNRHLERATQPASEKALAQKFGAGALADVKAWLAARGDDKTLFRLRSGFVSPAEMQNLEYGSWNMPNTPYVPGYDGKFRAFPANVE